MEFILYFFIFIFTVVGVSDAIHFLHNLLIKPKKKLHKVLVCVLDDDEAELQLNYIYEQQKWHGNAYFDKAIYISEKRPQNSANFSILDNFEYLSIKDIHKLHERLGG